MSNLLAVLALMAVLWMAVSVDGASRRTATLRRGSRGDCVKIVQRAVDVTADGIFGQNTENAVKAYQRRVGLTADGIVGRNTWASLYDKSGGGDDGSSGGGGNNCGCSYDNANKKSGGSQPGAVRLQNHLIAKFGGESFGIYNPRNVRGGGSLSLHAEGRAFDHKISGAAGQRVFDYAISIACQNGIQEVIFNRQIWTAQRGVKPYTGQSPHTDHVHVGLNRCGAQNFNL